MLNRADSQHESQSRLLREKQEEAAMHSRNDAQSSSRNDMLHVSPCRELTVGEAIDERIRKAERTLKSLHDLKANLPDDFLNAGASRIRGLLET